MMEITSCFNEISDGVITSVTDKVKDGEKIIQEATFGILDYGSKAILKSNKLLTDDEMKIKECFAIIAGTLKEHDIFGIFVNSSDDELREIFKF